MNTRNLIFAVNAKSRAGQTRSSRVTWRNVHSENAGATLAGCGAHCTVHGAWRTLAMGREVAGVALSTFRRTQTVSTVRYTRQTDRCFCHVESQITCNTSSTIYACGTVRDRTRKTAEVLRIVASCAHSTITFVNARETVSPTQLTRVLVDEHFECAACTDHIIAGIGVTGCAKRDSSEARLAGVVGSEKSDHTAGGTVGWRLVAVHTIRRARLTAVVIGCQVKA